MIRSAGSSSTSTWTPSTSASSFAAGPTSSASRSSSAAPALAGVIAAASYEARRYGVRSAMPSVTAKRLCPHAVFLPGDHALYASVSADVHRIFTSFTPLVEPLALDEAFLDVSGGLRLHGPGAVDRPARSATVCGTSCSCAARSASPRTSSSPSWRRSPPSRLPRPTVCARAGVSSRCCPASELAFLHPLPVQALWGVGPATLQRLQRLGVHTVADLAELDEAALVACGRGRARSSPVSAGLGRRRPPGRGRPGDEVDRPRRDVRHRPAHPRRARPRARAAVRRRRRPAAGPRRARHAR